ncbi:glycosyl-phosphatidylinositol-anchored molecule-like protein [Chlorocebus sabaeus]
MSPSSSLRQGPWAANLGNTHADLIKPCQQSPSTPLPGYLMPVPSLVGGCTSLAGVCSWPGFHFLPARSRLLHEVMLHFALLLAVGLPLVAANVTIGAQWTYSLRCHDCAVINDFNCPDIRTCPYHVRRCMTISIRINPRELLVYKNCTYNCTFLYAAHQPPEAPRKIFKTNSFYWVRCCNTMVCNAGGPTNLERDMLPDEVIEEELPEGTVRLGESKLFLSFASIIVSNILP